MKTCAEEKVKEVKVLERSVDDLQSTVCALEEQLARKVSQPNAVSVAKNKQGTELGKNIMHLHRQEEAMLSGSNSMHSEPSILIDEIFATNRGALAAESKENEDLHHQVDEALLLNGMLKDRMLEDLSLLQVNNAIPVNDMEGCSQFQLCNLLANYHHESVVINTIANDIETIVLASELKQHEAVVQEQMLMCTEVVEGLKTESTLWKVDQELGSAIIDDLLEESSNIRTDRENMKRNKDKIIAKVKRAKAATSLMCSLPK
jgi:kinesin family protein 15